jgi:serine/threonine-protein kinase RsbW
MSTPYRCISQEVFIVSDTTEGRRIQDEIEVHLRANEYGEQEIFSIRLALEEAIVNAIKHGNNFDRSKRVHVRYSISPDRFDVWISDEGRGFDPEDVPDPTDVENLERPCGRGLMLMRYYMSSVCYANEGRCVSMTKLRNGQSEKSSQ